MKINKPFTVVPTSLTPPSFLPAANPIHLAQGSSNLAQHHFKMHSTQGGKDLPNEITQTASKQSMLHSPTYSGIYWNFWNPVSFFLYVGSL